MSTIDWLAWVLVVLGALNWGLMSVASVNLVTLVFGTSQSLVQATYILIGVAGLYEIWVVLGNK